MKLLYTIETSPNPTGRSFYGFNYDSNCLAICALSPSSDNCYLAYPLPQKAPPTPFAPPSHVPPGSTHITPTSGEVLVFDAVKLEAINVVEAHRSPLSCIALNSQGTLLATASDKGTIIRVFSIPEGHKLCQFRRGSMPARIYSMSFNAASTLLCVSSATDTIHIFKLGAHNVPDEASFGASMGENSLMRTVSNSSATEGNGFSSRKHNGTLMGMLRRTSQNVGSSLATTVGGYLPKGVTEMWEPARDFAWVRLPKSPHTPGPIRSVVAMCSNTPQVMVVTSEGNFYVYNIDLSKGNEGTLTKQFSYVFQLKLLRC